MKFLLLRVFSLLFSFGIGLFPFSSQAAELPDPFSLFNQIRDAALHQVDNAGAGAGVGAGVGAGQSTHSPWSTITNDSTPVSVNRTGEQCGTLLFSKYTCAPNTLTSREVNGPDENGSFIVPPSCEPYRGVHFGYVHTTASTSDQNVSLNFTPFNGKTNWRGDLLVTNITNVDGSYIIAEIDDEGKPISDRNILGMFCTGNDTGRGDDNRAQLNLSLNETEYCVVYNGAKSSEPTDPLSCDPTVNLFENGSFEYPPVDSGYAWDAFQTGTPLLGWNVEWLSTVVASYGTYLRPIHALLELHRKSAQNVAYEGEQYAELDTDWFGYSNALFGEPASVRITQNIRTIPGARYNIQFAHSGKPMHFQTGDSRVSVVWNGMSTTSVDAESGMNTKWQKYSIDFTATKNITMVGFEDGGIANGLGGLIDSAALYCGDPGFPNDPGNGGGGGGGNGGGNGGDGEGNSGNGGGGGNGGSGPCVNCSSNGGGGNGGGSKPNSNPDITITGEIKGDKDIPGMPNTGTGPGQMPFLLTAVFSVLGMIGGSIFAVWRKYQR